MRQGAVDKPEGNTLALHVLLPDARRHLRDVDEGPLGAPLDHCLDVVRVRQAALRALPCRVTGLVQRAVHLGLESLHHGAPRLGLHLAALGLLDEVLHLLLCVGDDAVDGVHCARVGHRVPDADGETVLQEPVVHEGLRLVQERPSGVRAVVHPDDVDQAPGATPQGALAQRARQQLTVLDQDLRVAHGEIRRLLVRVPGGLPPAVGPLGDDEVEDLLPGPQGPRLQDRRLGDLPVPVFQPHEDVHQHVLLEEGVALGHDAAPQQRVLHDADHGLVRLGRHDHLGDHHQLQGLSARLVALRHVHVHLVPVEVGVVRRGHREVEPEGRVRQDLHAVPHDGHLVQARLPVEQHRIAVVEVALHLVPELQVPLLLQEPQVYPLAVLVDDVLGARLHRRRGGPHVHKPVELL